MKFPADMFTTKSNGTTTSPGQDGSTEKGNPFPTSESPRGGDIGSRYSQVSPTSLESSQSSSLFDRLRYWAYSRVGDAGDPEAWAGVVQLQAEALVGSVGGPGHYSAARVRTTAPIRSVSGRGSGGQASPAGIETWTQQSRLGGVDVAQKQGGLTMLTVMPKSAGFRWRALAKGPLPGRWVFPR